MTYTPAPGKLGSRLMLNKVPEVVIWFWIIKILCTTVGESFADWINMTLGVGLVSTAVLFTVIFAIVLTVQMRLPKYVPFAYWLTVVVVSVTGTLYTDILTDQLGVPLWISTTIFSVLLLAVFGIWYARERTLSIHSIVTTPREGFYWLAVLVTFALGTATGDWTLELTGWGPGVSVLLPLGLLAIVTALWRFGANPVLTFWIAYILTRPLGANIGDWLGTPTSEKGMGLGTFVTSVIFLGAILGTVLYLSFTRADVIEKDDAQKAEPPASTPRRRRISLAILAAAAVGTVALLTWTNSQPHTSALGEEGPAPSLLRLASQPVPGDPARGQELPRDLGGQLQEDHPGHAGHGRLRRPVRRQEPHHRPGDRVGRRPGHLAAQGLPGLDLRGPADRPGPVRGAQQQSGPGHRRPVPAYLADRLRLTLGRSGGCQAVPVAVEAGASAPSRATSVSTRDTTMTAIDTTPTARVLVVTDHILPTADLVEAIHRRAAADDVQFRVVVLNPARSEFHILHPERRVKAAEAELALREALPALEEAAGGHVIASVSVRHDPMDAIEETLFSEPIDEILISVPHHHLAERLHQDLPHRLHHYGLPVAFIPSQPVGG